MDGLSKLSSVPFADGETEVWTNNLTKGIQQCLPFRLSPFNGWGMESAPDQLVKQGQNGGSTIQGRRADVCPVPGISIPQDEYKYTGNFYRLGAALGTGEHSGTRDGIICVLPVSRNYRAIWFLGARACTVWEADPQGVLCLSLQWMHWGLKCTESPHSAQGGAGTPGKGPWAGQ